MSDAVPGWMIGTLRLRSCRGLNVFFLAQSISIIIVTVVISEMHAQEASTNGMYAHPITLLVDNCGLKIRKLGTAKHEPRRR